jgi:LuxR family maltose regulon positive regulatory protein
MESELSAAEVAILEARTEGWVAGLQLAALSLRGRADATSFVKAFGGDNRYIVDYLAEEVLQRQPEALSSFLLQTAILKRLNGALCDAVTNQTGGNAQLEFWSEATSLSFRWMTNVSGIAITTSLPTCFWRI